MESPLSLVPRPIVFGWVETCNCLMVLVPDPATSLPTFADSNLHAGVGVVSHAEKYCNSSSGKAANEASVESGKIDETIVRNIVGTMPLCDYHILSLYNLHV